MEKDLILVVDDEYSNRLLLEELLSDYEIVSAENGEEMWKILSKRLPSLILMDIMIPDEDGFVLVDKIKQNEKFKNIPIIFVSARETAKDIEKGFDIGAADYIRKPYTAPELESRIKNILNASYKNKEIENKVFTDEQIIDNISDSVFVLDKNFNIAFLNPAAVELTEFEKEEIIGKSISTIFEDKNLNNIFTSSSSKIHVDSVLISKNYDRIPVNISISRIPGVSEEEEAWVCVCRDISKQKLTEEKLIEAKNKAEEATKLKSIFLANMSHEIRTPMNSIIGFSELLEDPSISYEERMEFIDIIKKNSDKLLHFIENLLDVSVIEAGQIKISKSYCYVNQIFDELFSSFNIIKSKLEKNHIEFRLKKDIQDANFYFVTDLYRFQQILMNLLNNAFKFTNEGFVELGYNIIDEGATIKFYIKDSGVGIPSDKVDSIFETFAQVKYNGIDNFSGVGLGLAIARQLSEILGGKMSVETEVCKGTTFYLTMPLMYQL